MTLNRVKGVPPAERPRTPVSRIALPLDRVVLVAPDTPLVDLLPRLGAEGERRALVRENGAIVGLVSPTDVTRALELADLRGDADRAHL